MEFANRNAQAPSPAPSPQHAPVGTPGTGSRRNKPDKSKWSRIGAMAALLAVVILVVAVIIVLAVSNKTEDSYVNTHKLQAVFLNTGQVYFGNVEALNDKYFVLTNIYYLQTTGSNGSGSAATTANSNVTLVKLGCELHRPYDKMVINRQSVTFWENLESTGQVAQAVAKFQQQNPQGQKCSDQSSSSGSTTNATQPANNSGGNGSNGSTTPTTTTKNP